MGGGHPLSETKDAVVRKSTEHTGETEALDDAVEEPALAVLWLAFAF